VGYCRAGPARDEIAIIDGRCDARCGLRGRHVAEEGEVGEYGTEAGGADDAIADVAVTRLMRGGWGWHCFEKLSRLPWTEMK